MAKPAKSLELFRELEKQMRDEEFALSGVRDAEFEVSEFLKKQVTMQDYVNLNVSLFDRNRNEHIKKQMLEKVNQFFNLQKYIRMILKLFYY